MSRLKRNLAEFHECINRCRNACEHYGPDERGRVGCLLLTLETGLCPCRIEDHIFEGGGCLDLGNPKFQPVPVRDLPGQDSRPEPESP